LYSQFETADAKRMYPCFDQPDLKATFTVAVTAPASWQVVSNGAAVASEPDGYGVRHRFAMTVPMSTYVTALVAGPYHRVGDHHDGIDLAIYCRKTLAGDLDADLLFAQTKQGFDFFHRVFGVRYPFGKYDQLFVPEFNAGAMENAGAVTFREEYVFRSRVTRYFYERRCETLLHEMAHMWFGDLVTMRWWDDLWLNESFATWASVVAAVAATEFTDAWTTFANVTKSWAYVQDQLPSTHPISADMVDLEAVEVNFDGITYAKGASVLKQLAAFVGQEAFLAGLRDYFAAHAYANAELADLLRSLESASGRDLTTWSAEWLLTTGINEIRADISTGADGVITAFALVQGAAMPGAGELRRHRLAIGLYDDDGDGAMVRLHRLELDLEGPRVDVPELVGLTRPALVLVNDDDLTYCKARLDPASMATAVARIDDFADSLPRTLIWSAAWEMTRDALARARDYVALVLRGMRRESSGVLQRVVMQMILAVNSYADPGWADATGWSLVSGGLLALARDAEPGSDLQLVAVNSLCGARLTPEELSAIAGWLDGTSPLPGLAVDADMTWTLLGALVAHGWRGEADIAATAAADATASGDRRATQVRALLPIPEAKQAVFDRLMNDDTMTNAFQDAAIAGFVHPAQLTTLAGFTDQYFDLVADVWARRSSEVGQKVAVGLFPRWSINQATVAQALAFEARDHPPALKRLVSEGRAGLQRALAARAADRE
jgi:aminopeptidase N